MPSSADLGASAEALAAEHLRRLGYRILERNYRVRGGEIDLIARDGRVLCFVEVRSRRSTIHPAATVDARKQKRLILAARCYLSKAGDVPCRFDVVAVETHLDPPRLTLIRDAFAA